MGMCDRMCFWKYPDATQCPMCHQMCFGGQYSYILFMFVNLGAYPAHCSIFVFFESHPYTGLQLSCNSQFNFLEAMHFVSTFGFKISSMSISFFFVFNFSIQLFSL